MKIKPYLFRLIKENAVYIISIFFLLLMIIVVILVGLNRISSSVLKIKALTNEVDQLQKRTNFFQTTILPTEKLDEDIKLLNSLIPNIEDYFSIIYSLEIISQKTGFSIYGYSVDIGQSTVNKLRLSVTGSGDNISFMKFLDQYNFGGGRLITSDKIELNQESIGAMKIVLTFYNKDVPVSGISELPTDDKIFKDLEAIKQKVSFDFSQASEEANLDLSYPRKSNPF